MDLTRPETWIGVWAIDRRFVFETRGAPERFRGQAVISSVRPNLYLYAEEGFLEGLGKPIHASQRYWIRPAEGAEGRAAAADHAGAVPAVEQASAVPAVELLFAPDPANPGDAPHFVTLRPAADGALTGEHLCGEDRYAGVYRLHPSGSLRIEWTIAGPRKRGRIISELTRAPDEMGYA